MEAMRTRVNFLRESGGAAADNHTSNVAFFHAPARIKFSCLTSSSCRGLLAALQEGKQLRVYLVFMGRAHPVWRARNDFQRGALDQLRRKERRVTDGHDLVVVSMKNERGRVELLEVLREIRFGEGFDAIVGGLEPTLHALEPERIAQALRDFGAGAVGAVEGRAQILEKLRAVGLDGGANL